MKNLFILFVACCFSLTAVNATQTTINFTADAPVLCGGEKKAEAKAENKKCCSKKGTASTEAKSCDGVKATEASQPKNCSGAKVEAVEVEVEGAEVKAVSADKPGCCSRAARTKGAKAEKADQE